MLKFGLSLAVLALLGEVSALQLKTLRESDDLCDGDRADDRQLEDAGDPDDDIVDDDGFVNQWWDQRELTQIQARLNERPSDEVANGDESENKQLEDEDDKNDDIVDDNGFSHQWVQTGTEGKKHHKK